MRNLSFAAFVCLGLSPAQSLAQAGPDSILMAVCTSKQGCSCYLTDKSVKELSVLIPTTPPEGVPPLVAIADGTLGWSTITKEELDLTYGGMGLCDPQIFRPDETGLPQNGLWELTITGHELSGCPQQVADAISKEVIVGQGRQRNIVWPNPFSPAPLTEDNPAMNQWVRRSDGSWHTVMTRQGGGNGPGAQMSMTARIVNEREIATTSVFSTNVLAALTGSTCVSTTQATAKLKG